MSYFSLIRRRKELVRFRYVMAVLLRHGFGYVVYRLRLGEYLPLGKRFARREAEEKRISFGERLRLVCEELGPTFVKFGQLLSTRPDIIPPNVVRELAKLQDRVPPFPEEEARRIVEEELGRPVPELFAEFSPEPFAAASMAQVHRASLPDGEKVVVKVRRPGIADEVVTDIGILETIARGCERYIPESRGFYPGDLVKVFRRTIMRELDFTNEARNADRFRHNFEGSEDVSIPAVHWTLTTPRVLVMEDLEGIRVDRVKELEEHGIDPREVALKGARAFLQQVFVDRFFHGDPHPGNLSVLPDGRLALVDFGIVGRLDGDLLKELSRVLLAVADWDAARAARHLLRLNLSDEEVDEESFKSDLAYLIETYAGRPLREINLGHVITEMIYISARYRLRVPPDMVMLARALVTVEGVGRRLDPDFDMFAVSRGFARNYLLSLLKPAYLKGRAEEMAGDLAALVRELPSDLQLIVKKATKGRLKIEFQHRGLETFISEMDKSSNRLSFGLIVAALIIGSSLVTLSEKGPHMFGMPTLGLLGFTMAGLLGLWLIIGIIRSGRL